MFNRYLMFVGVCTLLPSMVKASRTCSPYRLNKFVTQKEGSAICGTSPPTETVTADFKLHCVDACLKHASCEDGFNYRSEAKLCELYLNPPTSYAVEPNCSYLKRVRRRFCSQLYLYYS